MYKPGEDSWVRYIKRRIDNNLNFLQFFVGPTGIGKSWATLSIAHKIDPDFDSSTQVIFNFLEFMRLINKFNNKPKEGEDQTLYKKKYKIIIFEEVQTGLNKRDWQSKINKLFLYLLSTFRHQNIIVLFTTPYSDFMDSASMKLIHSKVKCLGWSKKTKKSRVRPTLMQYNGDLQKFFYHSLYVIRDKKPQKLVNWSLECPPKHLIEPYEAKKLAFTLKLNEQITFELEQLDKGDNPDQETPTDTRKPLTERQLEVMEAVAKCGGQKEAAKYLGIAQPSVSQNVNLALKKGFSPKEFIHE